MWAKIWGLTGVVLLGAAISVSGFLYTPSIPDMTVVHVPKVQGQAVVTPEPEVKTETKTVVIYREEPRVRASEVVIPSTEEEQQKQLDQATIKNVEQDNQIAKIDDRVTQVEEKVATTPTPAPTHTPTPRTVTPVPQVPLQFVGMSYATMTANSYIYNSSGGNIGPVSGVNMPPCWNEGCVVTRFNKPVSVKVNFWSPYLSPGTDEPKFPNMNGDQLEQKLGSGDLDSEIITADATNLGNLNYVCYQTLGLVPGLYYMIGVEATDSSGNVFVDWRGTEARYYPR